MINDFIFLKTFSNRNIYDTYIPYISKKGFNPIELEILNAYGVYFQARPEVTEITDFEDFYHILSTIVEIKLSQQDKDLLRELVNKISKAETFPIETTITYAAKQKFSQEILIDVQKGIDPDPEKTRKLLEEYDEQVKRILVEPLEWELEKIFPPDIERKNALRFRMAELNKVTCGGLVRGDLVIVFSVTNGGKTLFCISEIANFLPQLVDNEVILYFNNEGLDNYIQQRTIQAVLGISAEYLNSHQEECFNKYIEKIGDPNKLLVFNARGMPVSQMGAIIKAYNAKLVVVDIADKAQAEVMKKADANETLRLDRLWALLREVACMHCPVIGTCQAGGDATYDVWEEKKLSNGQVVKYKKMRYKQFLELSNLMWSHNGKAGNADLVIGIGRGDDPDDFYRYLHLPKNKIGKTAENDRVRFTCKLDPKTGILNHAIPVPDYE